MNGPGYSPKRYYNSRQAAKFIQPVCLIGRLLVRLERHSAAIIRGNGYFHRGSRPKIEIGSLVNVKLMLIIIIIIITGTVIDVHDSRT